ncbi:phage tail tape measure protein [Salmonella enterica]|nr:phage tail tape measure protein [Salmonella enterica]EEA2271399.1 phage tail tape measure protein [Salmonella enterica]EFV5114804.1 phage tail tape measure protein [Salmonella enterica]EGB7057504.1 phage tail tape measure protein [Salmonella enterica]EKL9523960.1 phage tail tape measure protein [Salmonella enterica]
MSDRSLNIQVTFSALNKLSQPVSAARNAAAALAKQIKSTQGDIRALERQASSFDKLTQASKKTADSLEEAKQRAQSMRAEFGAVSERTEEQTAALEQQRKVIASLTSQQTKEISGLNQLRAAFYAEGVAISRDSTATEAITQRTARYNQQLTRQQQQLARVTAAQEKNARAQEASGKLKGAGMSTAMTGIAIGAPVVRAVMSYSSLEDSMKGVAKQVNGLTDNSGKRTPLYAEMQNAIKSRGENSGMAGGSEDYAALVEGGARMGAANSADPWAKQKADLLAFADTAAKASIAFELPADELSESLGKIAGLYKVPTKNIEQLGDALNYLDDNAKSKGADIIDVMQRIGGVADKLDYKKSAALASTMLSLGTAPEVAASSIQAMVRELSNATVQGKRFFAGLDALGLDAKSVQDSMSRDSMGTITAILNKVHSLKDTDQTPVLTQLFGKEFGSDAAKLANNLDELQRQLNLVEGGGAKGSMQRESDINKASISAQYNIAKAAMNNAAASLGETLESPLIAVMQDLRSLMDTVQQWVAANPGLAKSIMEVAAVLGVLLVALGGVMLAVGAILGPMALLKLSFATLAGAEGVSGLTGALEGLLSVGEVVLAPLAALFGALSWPVVLIGVAIAGVALLIYKYWEPLSAFFSGFWSGLMEGLQPVFDALKPFFAILGAIWGSVVKVWDWLVKIISPVQSTADELKKCTSAGKTFGEVLGVAISGLLWPMTQVAKGVEWILEKLNLVPGAVQAAADATRKATLDDKVNTLLGDMKAVDAAGKKQADQARQAAKKKSEAAAANSVKFDDLKGSLPRIASNTAKIADNTAKPKGPGAIVFKNTPALQRLRGGWREPVVQQVAQHVGGVWGGIKQVAGALAIATMPYAVAQPAQAARVSPTSQSQHAAEAVGNVYNITINASPEHSNPQDIAAMVRREIETIERQKGRAMRSRLRDND